METSNQAPSEAKYHPQTLGQGSGIASFILSLFAFAFILLALRFIPNVLGIILALSGVICGHVSIARSSRVREAHGLAIAGLVISYIALALGVLHLIGIFALRADLLRYR